MEFAAHGKFRRIKIQLLYGQNVGSPPEQAASGGRKREAMRRQGEAKRISGLEKERDLVVSLMRDIEGVLERVRSETLQERLASHFRTESLRRAIAGEY
jgi:hypothetical protein